MQATGTRPWQILAGVGMAGLGGALIVKGVRTRAARLRLGTRVAELSDAEASEASGYENTSRASMLEVEVQLQTLGYYPGELDGRYTLLTQSALAQFQAAAKLPVSGEPDTPTRLALEGAVAARALAAQDPEEPAPTRDECDPLSFDVERRLCLYDADKGHWVVDVDQAAMDRYIAEKAARVKALEREIELLEIERARELPYISSEQVGFSADFTRWETGALWRYRVLDPFLRGLYDRGEIVTVYRPDLADAWEEHSGPYVNRTDWTWGAVVGTAAVGVLLSPVSMTATALAVGKTYASYLSHADAVSEVHRDAMESTAAAAMHRFIESHTVEVGAGREAKLISELPDTAAVRDFFGYIAGLIGYFQNSQI